MITKLDARVPRMKVEGLDGAFEVVMALQKDYATQTAAAAQLRQDKTRLQRELAVLRADHARVLADNTRLRQDKLRLRRGT